MLSPRLSNMSVPLMMERRSLDYLYPKTMRCEMAISPSSPSILAAAVKSQTKRMTVKAFFFASKAE